MFFFFQPFIFSLCRCLFCGGSGVGSIFLGAFFYVFLLEHLIHIHLRLLSIGTYSLPFFPFVPVFLSLSLFLLIFLKQSL